jgi:hypothetical protein
MKRNVSVIAALCMAAAPVAADDLVWSGGTWGGVSSFAYAVPETDFVVVSFTCRSMGVATLAYPVMLADAPYDVQADVTLWSTTGEIVVPSSGSRSDMDDAHYLQGDIVPGRLLWTLLGAETLNIVAEGEHLRVPLAGAQEAARAFFQGCGVSN